VRLRLRFIKASLLDEQRGALQCVSARTRRSTLMSDCGGSADDQRAQNERTGTMRSAPPHARVRRSRDPEAQ